MNQPILKDLLDVEERRRQDIIKIAVKAAKDDPDLIEDFENLYNTNLSKAEEKCLEELAILHCIECKTYFSGGKIKCAEMLELDMDNVRCEQCSWQDAVEDHRCLKHGYQYAIYKCDSCCDVATFQCSTNHYCHRCHNQAYQKKNYPCPGPEKCKLGMPHPKNVEAYHGQTNDGFVVGCIKCIHIENVKVSEDSQTTSESSSSLSETLEKIENENLNLIEHQRAEWKNRFEKDFKKKPDIKYP